MNCTRSVSFLILCTIILCSSQSVVYAENIEVSYPPIIDFNIQDGEVITEESSFTVIIEDEMRPNLVFWRITGFTENIAFSDMTESLYFEESTGFRDFWSFDLLIGPGIYPSCSCILELVIEDHTGEIYQFHMSIFIVESMESMPASIFVFGDQKWSSNYLEVTGISKSLHGDSISLLYQMDLSPAIRCSVNTDSTLIESEYSEVEDIFWSNSLFSFNLGISNLDDGWYDLQILSRVIPNSSSSPIASPLYAKHCISIRVDNTPPEVIINGPSFLDEGYSKIEYSGEGSTDATWGISGLTYVWSLNQIVDNYSRVIEVISISNERKVSFDRTSSGTFQIGLTIIDKAGNSANSYLLVEVNNTAPIVRLQIDSVTKSGGETVDLRKGEKLSIDASLSSDTDNDMDSLRYIWRVNNIPMYVGSNTELTWPEGIEDEFLLTLEVLDDDSESSTLSIYVKDPDNQASAPFHLLLLLASAFFFAYSLMRFRVKTGEPEIPKW